MNDTSALNSSFYKYMNMGIGNISVSVTSSVFMLTEHFDN
jgi:hypothetical protein